MSNNAKFRTYEYILYWIVTVILLILAIPIVIVKFIKYLVKSAGAPLKSAKNFFGFILVILIVITLFIGYKIYIPYNIGDEIKSISVSKNESFAGVIDSLTDKDILHDARLFRIIAVITGLDKTISPGRYDFSGPVSLKSIRDKFRRKEIATFMVTVPEGQTVWQTAATLSRSDCIDSAAFLNLAFDTAYTLDKFGLEGLEGYLFPETYQFWYQIELEEVIEIMIDMFRKQTDNIDFDEAPNGLSEKDVIVLASIIQAEARDNSELGLISSVYHNRLSKKMRLQADPTVIYAIGGLDRPLWYRDLEFDSPYNTYKYLGLPPGPINSPGLAAIKAAIYPAESNYLYFVADGTGKHIFSETLGEHNRARASVKKSKRN